MHKKLQWSLSFLMEEEVSRPGGINTKGAILPLNYPPPSSFFLAAGQILQPVGGAVSYGLQKPNFQWDSCFKSLVENHSLLMQQF